MYVGGLEDFTVYDIRVCQILKKSEKLINKINVDKIISEYFEYLADVKKEVLSKELLREKDKFLGSKSFYLELT